MEYLIFIGIAAGLYILWKHWMSNEDQDRERIERIKEARLRAADRVATRPVTDVDIDWERGIVVNAALRATEVIHTDATKTLTDEQKLTVDLIMRDVDVKK